MSESFERIVLITKNHENPDKKGVIYQGRENLNQWKSSHAIETKDRTLSDAIENADVFLGLSAAGVVKKSFRKSCKL